MLLITFEGIDGSGKSTQVQQLRGYLQEQGRAPLVVREPGGTDVSERVRSILLDPELDVEPMAELFLFSAARAQLSHRKIRPALDAGRIVICDRFYDSTTAYQGAGRNVAPEGAPDADWLEGLHRRATGNLVPDRTYLVEVDPETALRRRSAEGLPAPDRMELAPDAFYARVADAYDRLAQRHPERFLRLDGTRPIADVHARIRTDVDRLLQHRDADPPGTGP
jgi:dTMP kinase